MPNILIKIPHGSFPGAARDALFASVTAVADEVEQLGDSPRNKSMTSVIIEELPAGALRSAGRDTTDSVLLCVVQAYIPAGVLDGAARAAYAAGLAAAFRNSMPEGDTRRVIPSTLLLEVPEGQWGAGDVIWRLPDLAAASGYKHLQSVAKK